MKALVGISTLGLALACGGSSGTSGGGDLDNGTAPIISNLQYAPTSAVLNQGGGTVTLAGTFDFSDPDGDVTTLRLATATGNLDTPIQGAAGVKSATLNGAFAVSTTQLGHFTFQVSLLDGKGHQSNSLPGFFDVTPDDSGAIWTQRWDPIMSGISYKGVACSGNQYVVVGSSGAIIKSPDGHAWSMSTSPVSVDLYRATWAGSQFVVVGDQGTILTSPDGAAWTLRRSTGVSGDILYSVAWSGSTLVAVGGGTVLRSQDGITWAPATTPSGGTLYAVASSGSGFLAVGGDPVSGLAWTSADGLTWQASALPSGSRGFTSLVWSGSHYIVTGPGTSTTPGTTYVTTDGTDWSSPNLYFGGAREVAWSGYHFLFYGGFSYGLPGHLVPLDLASNGTIGLLYPTTDLAGQMVWAHNQWLGLGSPGYIWTSP